MNSGQSLPLGPGLEGEHKLAIVLLELIGLALDLLLDMALALVLTVGLLVPLEL